MTTDFTSTFSWLDSSESERKAVMELVSSLNEPGTLDELGIGSIRDTIANVLFPGTSTIQTRARYFLFIPWISQMVEARPRANSDQLARQLELQLCDALSKAHGAGEGVIGREARESLQRWPSSIYWVGLERWGIRREPGSIPSHQDARRRPSTLLRAMSTPDDPVEERRYESADGAPSRWAKLPPPPEGFPDNATFNLSPEELTRDAPTSGQTDNSWYAVAPLLLDSASPDSVTWMRQHPDSGHRSADTDDAEHTVWSDLVAIVSDQLAQRLANPGSLGRAPEDLAERLALLALASPANTSLRALSRVTAMPTSSLELKREALQAAWGFRSFFRSPTSEGLLQNVYSPSISANTGTYLQRVLAYCAEGGLSAVLDEFFNVTREAEGGETTASDLVDSLCKALQLATGRLEVVEWGAGMSVVHRRTYPMRQHFARRYSTDRPARHDPQSGEHVDAVRSAFNSPFWPFVLATTSVGQEGLDFHWYCHAVVHWNLPSNPVDLEQREGRVHRYHGHAIRKNIAEVFGGRVAERVRTGMANGQPNNPWDLAYTLADDELGDDGGRKPHWVFPEGNARIHRYAPVLPLSRDAARIDSLRQALTVYRMVFGQPRQDDLLEFILGEVPENRQTDLAAALTIDLGPPGPNTC